MKGGKCLVGVRGQRSKWSGRLETTDGRQEVRKRTGDHRGLQNNVATHEENLAAVDVTCHLVRYWRGAPHTARNIIRLLGNANRTFEFGDKNVELKKKTLEKCVSVSGFGSITPHLSSSLPQ